MIVMIQYFTENIMFKFFKRQSSKTQSRQQSTHMAPGTQICYIPNLVENLRKDHKALLNIFGKIKSSFEAGKFRKVEKNLKTFRRLLTDHLLTENVRLYIYLGHEFAQDEVTSDLVKEFKSEMNQISKVVMAFLTKYETIGVNKGLSESFNKDLNAIGQALTERIQREENTLYPLYMPSY
ncbi:MAG TPA: hemerythrin domain-containing protein [Oceanospirillales bacterium]|nr:hemerythrin domain-containing protein [Oceanospirillales bacterium]